MMLSIDPEYRDWCIRTNFERRDQRIRDLERENQQLRVELTEAREALRVFARYQIAPPAKEPTQ